MKSSAVASVHHLTEEYRRFLRTSYRFLDPQLRAQFEQHLAQADVVVKGPYVTLSQDFELAETLQELVDAKSTEPELLKANWPFGTRPLYRHQVSALGAGRSGRCFVVTTGTGSGKTEAFLLPVFDGILRRKREGVTGVQAVLLYPMNALANDQLERLRRMLKGTGLDISYALYTGDSDTANQRLAEEPAETERLTRTSIRRSPPDILLTNYKQLEFLLVRAEDRALFTPALKYLVLDEVHSYRGTQATEIACLIRRLKAHAQLKPGDLAGIATSATVASSEGARERLSDFATVLFGESFEADSIIGEAFVERVRSPSPWAPPMPALAGDAILGLDLDDDSAVRGLAETLTGRSCPPGAHLTDQITQLLEGNLVVEMLEEVFSKPASVAAAVRALREKFPDRAAQSDEQVQHEVEAYHLLGSIGDDQHPPRLRPKLHTFFHGVYDVALCMNPECRALVPQGGTECLKCGSVTRPASLCRTCGQDFVKVRFEKEDDAKPVGTGDFYSDERSAFITHQIHKMPEAPGVDDDSDEEGSGKVLSLERRQDAEARLESAGFCLGCGRIFNEDERCPECNRDAISVLLRRGALHTCQTWRPYFLDTCPTPRCGEGKLLSAVLDEDNFYVRLYLDQPPKRLAVSEHSAQIPGDQRADIEREFKEGFLDVLVCSPTLELGVDIGPLLTVVLRNVPPTPANYAQRVGRAGRRLRIGFVSTFCAGGAHDRHGFEEPEWLVAGEFDPPKVRLNNPRIVQRHLRSFLLEHLDTQLPSRLGDLLDDLRAPTRWESDKLSELFDEVGTRRSSLVPALAELFAEDREAGRVDRYGAEETMELAASFNDDLTRILERWWRRVEQLKQEHDVYSQIGTPRQDKKKAAARERAYFEITQDRERAYMLNYLSTQGFLPAYQFPIDTFSLDPGVADTPTLYRASAIAIEEFAPGNFVYANGHKLKSIRVLFAGGPGAREGTAGRSDAEAAGRLQAFQFCERCDEVVEETRNSCPRCGANLPGPVDAVFVDAFEAEESLRIGSDEESRQRQYHIRRESLLTSDGDSCLLYPYPFAPVEYRNLAQLLVTNWGKSDSKTGDPHRFWLCPDCGRHQPYDPNNPAHHKNIEKWRENHGKYCGGEPVPLILAYKYTTDCLVLTLQSREDMTSIGRWSFSPTLVTLAEALLTGASNLLELEPFELEAFVRPASEAGKEEQVVIYETVPGGAGYVEEIARRLPEVARAAQKRLYKHSCAKACYLCLKHYRNQRWHISARWLVESNHRSHCPYKGDARYWSVRVGERIAENAVWSYPDPIEGAPDLANLAAFYWHLMEAWFEEDEEVFVHARDPYHRIDVLESSRHVAIEIDGVKVADSRRPRLLFETGLPTRYYLPKLDVRMDMLRPRKTSTACPYKGVASYWAVQASGEVLEDVVWSYPSPYAEAFKIAGLLCFYNEKVDLHVDGVLQERPRTHFA